MRDVASKAAFALWLSALAVCLVAGSDVILVAFPVMMAAAAILIALCYGVGNLVLKLLPAIAALAAVGALLRAVGMSDWMLSGLVIALVIVVVPPFERMLARRA